ncbi:MAG: outer membrane lipid asymmetry maintenance protein MlaD [Alphaproteobacteria bacterium]|nr:outer membrane lipid asymmetry maintenance protein MlaD [Alphaproteobacteria bacterium]
MQKNIIETLMGAVVLVVAGAFLIFAYQGSNVRVEDGYIVRGNFSNATGVSLGSDVRVGGIKVGVISDMQLDPQTYEAIVSMQIRKATKLPKDSSAAISSSGLLGEKYISVTPGSDDKMLADGGRIDFTQSGVNLEEMIGKFMFSGGGVDKKKDEKAEAAAPAQ